MLTYCGCRQMDVSRRRFGVQVGEERGSVEMLTAGEGWRAPQRRGV